MPAGNIKKLFVDKHCGFIAPAAGGPDVFFHGTVVAGNEFRSLITGQHVEFELDPSSSAENRGPRASRVRPLGGTPSAAPQGEFRPLRRHRAARAKKPTWRKGTGTQGDEGISG